ncbi:MAG TPA: hypothetical protein VG028_13750 [Terriglobia bacterium]|nr:hypothetical protein [Terriglobia bacterium]
MKKNFEAWLWSLGVLARSPASILALGVLSALWVLAADQWLGLQESSGLMLLFSFLWALAQILIAVSVLAGSAASAAESAAFGGPPRIGLTFATFNRSLLARTVLFALWAALIVFIISQLFTWVSGQSLEVASFLTFHSEKPTSHILIETIFWWIEFALWIVVCAFLLTFLIVLLRSGWTEALRQSKRILRGSFGRASFFTVLAGGTVFGGLAYFLVQWHPHASSGFWDYAQAAARLGFGLLLLVAGWLFTLLALARQNPRQEGGTQP